MRYLLTLIAGLLVGAIAAVALLLFNPLIGPADAKLDDLERAVRYEWPSSALSLTYAGTASVPTLPEGVESLWERTVRRSALGTFVVAGNDERAAVASRALVPSARTELLTEGVVVDDLWLLTFPGEGSLFVVAETNVWPIAKDTLVTVSLLGREFAGPRDYVATSGPATDGRALVLGATGAFAERQGRAVERYRVSSYARGKGFGHVSAELRFVLDPAPAKESEAAEP